MTEPANLFSALAEQLKNPLLQIRYQAELAEPTALLSVQRAAEQALRLIDGYLLSANQQALVLEPVSVSAVLYDVAQALDPLARQYNAEIEIEVAGKYGPVMAHQPSLQAALVTLGQSLLEADTTAHPRLILSAYRGRHGISAGIFGNQPELTPNSLRKAMQLVGRARQPLPTVTALNGAGLYIAEALLAGMDARLRVVRRHSLTGLAASLIPSKQLQLI